MSIAKSFSLHLTDSLGSTAWALAADVDGRTTTVIDSGIITSTIDDTVRSSVVVQVIDKLRGLDHVATGGLIDLFIFDKGTRKILLDLGGEFGPVSVLTKSQMTITEGWDRAGLRRCLDLLGHQDFAATDRDTSRRIEAATDGSYGRGRGGGGSAGWVREDGRFGFATVDSGNILVAELSAVASLLAAAEAGERLLVHVDSQAAIRAIEVEAKTEREPLGTKAENLLLKIEGRRRHVDAQFVWVKAHQGHPLNDAADRLARLARQTQDVDLTTRTRIAKNIVEDALNTHRELVAVAA